MNHWQCQSIPGELIRTHFFVAAGFTPNGNKAVRDIVIFCHKIAAIYLQ
ncbi:hypothetical protein GWD52_11960 [Enterobacteriaceae bacterium 4M9]|nr:hypothetical protein [Enterobacteriaceae bacterium 4M9]